MRFSSRYTRIEISNVQLPLNLISVYKIWINDIFRLMKFHVDSLHSKCSKSELNFKFLIEFGI